MKILKSFIFSTLFFIFMSSAIAAYTPKDVVNAVNNGEWQKAEVMIKEVTTTRPESAQAWFYRAQIELELAKKGEISPDKALTSLMMAKQAPKKMENGDSKYALLEGKINTLMSSKNTSSSTSSPNDNIKNAIINKKWSTAEKLLVNKVADNPEDAQSWYYLAQVSEHTGNYELGVKAINKALSNDRTASFASNASSVSSLKERLQNRLDSSNVTEVVQKPVVSEKPVQKTTPAETVKQKETTEHSGGISVFLKVLVVFIILAAVIFFIFSFKKKKEESADKERNRIANLSYINDTYKELETMAEDLAFIDKDKTKLYEKIINTKNSLATLSISFTSNSTTWLSQMPKLNKLKMAFDDIKMALDKKDYDLYVKPASSTVRTSVPKDSYTQPRVESKPIQRTSKPYRNDSDNSQHHHRSSSNNNDLLTGVVLGSVLSSGNSHSSTTIIKESSNNDDNESSFDFGSSSTKSSGGFDFGSSSSSSSFDFGSSDNSSSFDSGSSSSNNDW